MLKTGTPIYFDDFLGQIDEINLNDPNDFARISDLRIIYPKAQELLSLDPFSAQYKQAALKIYEDLKGKKGYAPENDEHSFDIDMENVFAGVSPWSLKSTKYLSEFFYSWAQIFSLLDVNAGDSVLEYGPGSGHLLLMLARAGIDAYGVDIDRAWLEAIEKQAKLMRVPVSLEQNFFGKGFEGRRFDRIVFFEAFHHAFDFLDLLDTLKRRLTAAGAIIFCGEPVLGAFTDSVPYPWGPRLDGLSVYVIRKKGWMELGFTHDFFTQALCRAGYDVSFHFSPDCGRACAYKAVPGSGRMLSADAVADGPLASTLRKLRRRFQEALSSSRQPSNPLDAGMMQNCGRSVVN